MPCVPASAGAQRTDYEEEVAEDGNSDGDDVQRDPSPLVFVLQQVARHLGEDVVAHSGIQACLWIDALGGDEVGVGGEVAEVCEALRLGGVLWHRGDHAASHLHLDLAHLPSALIWKRKCCTNVRGGAGRKLESVLIIQHMSAPQHCPFVISTGTDAQHHVAPRNTVYLNHD